MNLFLRSLSLEGRQPSKLTFSVLVWLSAPTKLDNRNMQLRLYSSKEATKSFLSVHISMFTYIYIYVCKYVYMYTLYGITLKLYFSPNLATPNESNKNPVLQAELKINFFKIG